MVGLECAGEVLEQVGRVALGVLDGLKDDDPLLQRDRQGGEFEVGSERAALVVEAGERLGQRADLDSLMRRAACRVRFATGRGGDQPCPARC